MYGNGLKDIGRTYKAPRIYQKGYGHHAVVPYYMEGNGIGMSFFRNIISFLTPLIKSGSKAVAKEVFRSGNEILENYTGSPDSPDLSTLIKEQKKKSISNLVDKAKNKVEKLRGAAIKRKSRKKLISRSVPSRALASTVSPAQALKLGRKKTTTGQKRTKKSSTKKTKNTKVLFS
jgi:hypothetical protein